MLTINSFPPEILAQVFKRAVDMTDAIPRKKDPPLNISGVCRSWRHLAIGTKYIWTRLNLDPCKFHVGRLADLQRELDLLRLYLYLSLPYCISF